MSGHHRIAGPEPVPLDRFAAAPELREAIGAWHAWLGDERRCSSHTLAAYGGRPGLPSWKGSRWPTFARGSPERA